MMLVVGALGWLWVYRPTRSPAVAPTKVAAPAAEGFVPQGPELRLRMIYYPLRDLSAISGFSVDAQPKGSGNLLGEVSAVIDALARPPGDQAVPVFPPGLQLRHAFLDPQGTLYVDLPAEAFEASSAGVRLEILAVEAVVASLVQNVAGAKAVKLLAHGSDRESFWGHVDLRLPLAVTP